MGLTFTRKLTIAAMLGAVAMPVMALTADSTGQIEGATRVTASEITLEPASQAASQAGPVVTFDVAAAPGAPASAVAVGISNEPGAKWVVSVKSTSARAIRRVTLQARIASTADPTAKPRTLTSAPVVAAIRPGETVDVVSGLLDLKSATALATDGPIRVTFSVVRVEFAAGDAWPIVPGSGTPPSVSPEPLPHLTAPEGPPYDSTAPGIVAPVVVRQSDPKYTAEALRAKIQGAVELRLVVGADGTVGDVEVTKSLDTEFGLDQQAVNAARQWRFTRGTLNGRPVPTTVVLQMEFRVH